ncbi:methylated-DNA--[protein]-cysteine S-methyltransferase [Aestuariispira insulae]|uniref:DNA-O6-methylguanine--protein-cysteine S-methyltransferase /transcriptional regulator Ada n=1 Tax=Aestuariispira insulae TaxID=1461337 RepID=A0A3D9HK12_9PROT|nr:methylated-DNA--[protein]-cysteine S-methyltransferase [Aestuariispira insulae]RED49803.1 DNA-O6-methylguanine--protein-cysteine S-methyltransferase /transcriptional regulator Ada [Aestuariispira insulae]
MTDTYTLIERALNYLSDHWEDQPELSDLADHVGMSEYHLQRLFTKWAGISPKKFLSQLTLDQARRRLEANESILDAALGSGLSGPGRLHDLFVTYEAMTPGEYKRQGDGLVIRYGWHEGPFGATLLMVTDRGLCGLAFEDERGRDGCFAEMAERWPGAFLREDMVETKRYMNRIFHPETLKDDPQEGALRLVLKGTEYQVKVWEALMTLPQGSMTTYGNLAKMVSGGTGGARAIGSAVGANPIAWLIPCHRVIRSSGALGGYRWGLPRKLAMLGMEAS